MRCRVGHAWAAGLAAAVMMAAVIPASAGNAWEEIRASVFGDRKIEDGSGIVHLSAPNRPEDMRIVPIAVEAAFVDGRTVKSVSVIIDENPTPVVAVFRVKESRESLAVKSNFRVDRQSDVRAIVEASDGRLFMVSQLVKFAGGQASCSAPPQGDPAEIAANMGKMKMTEVKAAESQASRPASRALGRARISLNHPNHTGMVMDQITLLYTPMKMISDIIVKRGGNEILKVDGSIALSQNPVIEFDYPRNGTQEFEITMKDTDGASWTKAFQLGPES